MKKGFYIFIVFCFAGVFSLKAQTLTNSIVAGIGSVQPVQYIDAGSIIEGPSGAGQTWNFTGVSNLSIDTFSVVAPTLAGYFPNATEAIRYTSGTYNYVQVTSSQEQYLGSSTATTINPYTDPEITLVFPFSLNTTHTDTWAMTEYYMSADVLHRTGTTTILADASGTITTPAGTFSNVLRMMIARNYSDSSFNNGVFTTASLPYADTTYLWAQEGHVGFIFSFSKHYDYSLSNPRNPNTAYYQPAQATGIQAIENGTGIYVFPNPAHDKITLNIRTGENDKVVYTLTNTLGQVVYRSEESTIKPGNNNFQVSTSAFAAGNYSVRCTGEKTNISRQVVIE